MAVIVVGGQTRNVGKTGVVTGIIAAMPERSWTAIKLTQHSHGIIPLEAIDVHVECDAGAGSDSSRYMAAGAARALWMRVPENSLAGALPVIEAEIARAENVIIESNSILALLRPDLYLLVLNPAMADFKPSALRYLDRADAILMRETGAKSTIWADELNERISKKRLFHFSLHPGGLADIDLFLRQEMLFLRKKRSK